VQRLLIKCWWNWHLVSNLQYFIIFVTYKLAQSVGVFVTDKPFQLSVMEQSSLLDRFLSFKENEVLWIRLLGMTLIAVSACNYFKINLPIPWASFLELIKWFNLFLYLHARSRLNTNWFFQSVQLKHFKTNWLDTLRLYLKWLNSKWPNPYWQNPNWWIPNSNKKWQNLY
jgi:hypothetical protein